MIPPAFRGASPETLYLRPLGFLAGPAAAAALAAGDAGALCGDPQTAFTRIGLVRRLDGGGSAIAPLPVAGFRDALRHCSPAARARLELLLDRLTTRRAAWGPVALDRPSIMGIVNVTPDSFSDGGDHETAQAAIAHGLALAEAGADILDIGGESTRPGAAPVPVAEEIARVVPVIRALAAAGARVSIDTRHTAVMAAALDAGAHIINDVTALAAAGALDLVASRQAPVVLMHMRGEPKTMQSAPRYDAAPLDIFDYLEARLGAVEAAGLPRSRCLVDPGIGFGKTLDHNLEIMGSIGLYHALGCGILLGASRKRLIAGVMGREVAPKQRLGGSLALALAGLESGVRLLRVHDVAETVQAVRVWQVVRHERAPDINERAHLI